MITDSEFTLLGNPFQRHSTLAIGFSFVVIMLHGKKNVHYVTSQVVYFLIGK